MTMEQRAVPLERKAEEVIDQVREQIDEIEDLLDGLDSRVRTFVTERPLLALAGTLLAGFLAGRIFSRR